MKGTALLLIVIWLASCSMQPAPLPLPPSPLPQRVLVVDPQLLACPQTAQTNRLLASLGEPSVNVGTRCNGSQPSPTK